MLRAWFPPKRNTDAVLFYDGECGLCHRWVKFTMKRDRDGDIVQFAALQGETIRQKLSDHERDALPDSVVFLGADNQIKTKSTAVIAILDHLGGFWRVCAGAMKIIPRAIRDFGYDRVAAIRHKLFRKPKELCPMMPPEMRDRFLP